MCISSSLMQEPYTCVILTKVTGENVQKANISFQWRMVSVWTTANTRKKLKIKQANLRFCISEPKDTLLLQWFGTTGFVL